LTSGHKLGDIAGDSRGPVICFGKQHEILKVTLSEAKADANSSAKPCYGQEKKRPKGNQAFIA